MSLSLGRLRTRLMCLAAALATGVLYFHASLPANIANCDCEEEEREGERGGETPGAHAKR